MISNRGTTMLNYSYRRDNPYDVRVKEAYKLSVKYPDKRPVICDPKNIIFGPYSSKKFLVPYTFTIAEIVVVLRNRLQLQAEETIFVFINNKIFSPNTLIGDIYNSEKSNDGFLYLTYSSENTFG